MFPATFRKFALLAVTGVTAALAAAAESSRATPSRPGASSSASAKKFSGIEYLNVADVARRLGLKQSFPSKKSVVVTASGVRAELERDSRDATVNGVRVLLGDPIEETSGQFYVSRIDFERCLAPMLRPGHGATLPAKPRTIVLDPGHGGKDQGTSVHEKTYALDVAKRTKTMLERAGYRVVLTRDDDTYLTLQERPAVAHAHKADLFVSIHFNAVARDSKTSGFEIFTFPPRSQRSTDSWSPTKRIDAEDESAPVNRFDHWNVALAHSIHRRFIRDMKSVDRGKKLMHLGVLRSLNCPGVLVECGFLSSTAEAKKIATAVHRQKIAETLAAGVRDYAATLESVRAKIASAKR